MKRILKQLLILSLAAALGIGASFAVAAWTGPSSNPPGSNKPVPLNTTTALQQKGGSGIATLPSRLNVNDTTRTKNLLVWNNAAIGDYTVPTGDYYASNLAGSPNTYVCVDADHKLHTCPPPDTQSAYATIHFFKTGMLSPQDTDFLIIATGPQNYTVRLEGRFNDIFETLTAVPPGTYALDMSCTPTTGFTNTSTDTIAPGSPALTFSNPNNPYLDPLNPSLVVAAGQVYNIYGNCDCVRGEESGTCL